MFTQMQGAHHLSSSGFLVPLKAICPHPSLATAGLFQSLYSPNLGFFSVEAPASL